jgi:hypothetical protein
VNVTRARDPRLARRVGPRLAVGLLALAGCGSDPAEETTETAAEPPAQAKKLPPAEQQRAFEAQQTITAYCGRVHLSLRGDKRPPSAAESRRAHAAADRLAALARARPFDLVQTGVDTRLYVGDLIEDLGNVNCDPGLVASLEEGLG